ncbi:hypothetical protein WT08_22170 [Burkholderia sp. MSMB1552]|nr:hypothetical protein WT08_22170 [Burkholderia sp. MSMB1552]KWZ55741.1 hypothetical protein WS92_07320 [Burkholderia sp. MSMB1588]
MVLDQGAERIAQRPACRGGQHARLGHATAQRMTHAPRCIDDLRVASEDGASRAGEPFGKTHRDGIDPLDDLVHGTVRGDRRIEQPRAIQMHRYVMAMRCGDHVTQRIERVQRAAAPIVWVFQCDQARPFSLGAHGLNRARHVGRRQSARIAGQCMKTDAGKPLRTVIGDVQMAQRIGNHRIPRSAMHTDGGEVGHRGGWQE